VSGPEFHFGITLDGQASAAETDGTALVNALFVDVFRSVLWQAGVTGDAADRLLEQLLAAHRAAPPGSWTVRFVAHQGRLDIVLSQGGGDWRTSCPVPIK
jgi:hypothetical protein